MYGNAKEIRQKDVETKSLFKETKRQERMRRRIKHAGFKMQFLMRKEYK